MADNEQPPAPIAEASPPEVVKRPLWVLSHDEQRVLIITFVGGLASIIVGACVIGGAIALARGLKAIHVPLYLLIIWTVLVSFIVVWGAIVRPDWSGPGTRAAVITFLVMCFVLSILLLAWIGVAAGIH